MITKNHLITREWTCWELVAPAPTAISRSRRSIPSCTRDGAARLDPEAALRRVETLADAGVPVGVMVAPVIPGLTDHEIPGS